MAVTACSVKGEFFYSGNGEMMVQILTHRLPGDRRQMTSGNNAGSQWDGSAVEQVFGQVILAGQHHGQPRFGVGLELGDGMQFGKDIEAQQ
jgi:hypothetical protein